MIEQTIPRYYSGKLVSSHFIYNQKQVAVEFTTQFTLLTHLKCRRWPARHFDG